MSGAAAPARRPAIPTTIAGSLPKPRWLAEPGVLRAPWRLEGQALAEGQDDAVGLWLADQEEAGIDIVTDGEQRRRHYIWGFLERIAPVDFDNPGLRESRGGRYAERTPAPRLLGELHWDGPALVDALRFARGRTGRRVKVTLPGPMTVADSVIDEAGGRGDERLASDYAEILNLEARALADAGADVVQIDEPCFNIHLDAVRDWGVGALERAFEGVAATRAVHVCYGYGTETVLRWKGANSDWSHYESTLPLLAGSAVDQVSVECAASGVDPAVLGALEGKDVLVGVVDVGTDEVESAETVADRIRAALEHVPAERLVACTDCGMAPRGRAAARGKLRALSAGAALVSRELGG